MKATSLSIPVFGFPVFGLMVACSAPAPVALPDVVSKQEAAPRVEESESRRPAPSATVRQRHIEYYTSGRKKLEGFLVAGVRSGLWTYYAQTGFKTWQGVYVDGELHGPYSLWKRGKKHEEGAYRAGRKHGRWLKWETDRGFVWEVSTYDSDLRSGPFTRYHGSGKTAEQGRYDRGLRHGVWTSFHENGQKSVEHSYDKGSVKGTHVTWHDNGQKQSEGQYESGRKNGIFKYWDEAGAELPQRVYRATRRTAVRPGPSVPRGRGGPAAPTAPGPAVPRRRR